MSEIRMTARGKEYEPKEYKVYTPAGQYYARDADLEACKRAADSLGAGAKVEGLDQMLCETGDIIYTAE